MHNLGALGDRGYVHVKGMLEKELCYFLTHTLIKAPEMNHGQTPVPDDLVPTCVSVVQREIIFDTLLERMWPFIENAVGEELLPTYSYARLYTNNDSMRSHIDRPTCEVSVTLQLGRSHNYAYPIFMNGTRFDLAEGDGVIYLGEKVPHWREVCQGPDNYYSGQAFLHYVRKNGPHADLVGDMKARKQLNLADKIILVKNRTILMEEK